MTNLNSDSSKDYQRLLFQGRMLDAIADAVIATDPTGKIIYWNDASTKTYGWRAGEVTGRDLTAVLTQDPSIQKSRAAQKILEKRGIWFGEYVIRHKDGHTFPVSIREAPVFDDEGKLLAFIVTSHNISARKKVEEQIQADLAALSRMHELGGKLLSAAGFQPMLQEVLDTAVAIMHADMGTLQLHQDSSVKVVAHHGHRHPYLKSVTEAEVQVSKTQFAQKYGERLIIPNLEKSPIPLSAPSLAMFREAGVRALVSTPLSLAGGEIIGVLTIQWATPHAPDDRDMWRLDMLARQAADLIDHSRYEQVLRESEARYREVAEKSGSIILRFTPEGKITYFNEFAERFFGYSRKEVVGQPVIETIVPHTESVSGRDLHKLVQEIVAYPEQYLETENENIRKNGGRVWVRWTHRPVFNKDGSIREFTSIGTDMTDRKRAEEQLKKKNLDLAAAYEENAAAEEALRTSNDELIGREHELSDALSEKEALLSEIHHRVKNNLTAFISLLSLEGAYEDSDAGAALKKDLQNRARSMALIHETLYRTHNYSNVEMQVYLGTLSEQIIKSYELKRPIHVVIDARGITLDLARATPVGLILNELITNSIKYAFPEPEQNEVRKPHPLIMANLIRSDKNYVLTVKDNGIGLPENLDISSTKTLGLKLVYFLARHQLRAQVSARTDGGALFSFIFPENVTSSAIGSGAPATGAKP